MVRMDYMKSLITMEEEKAEVIDSRALPLELRPFKSVFNPVAGQKERPWSHIEDAGCWRQSLHRSEAVICRLRASKMYPNGKNMQKLVLFICQVLPLVSDMVKWFHPRC